MSVSRRKFLVTSSLGLTGAMIGIPGLMPASSPAYSELLAPELIKGGGKNYNVWPTGMAKIDHPNLQWAIDNVRDGGFIRLHISRDVVTDQPIPFELGPNNVRIRGKSLILIGSSSQGVKPTIVGRSDKTAFSWASESERVGVVRIEAPNAEIEMRNLEIHHVFAPAPPNWAAGNPGTFGSATIANEGCAELRIIDCDIETFASSGIASYGRSGGNPFTMSKNIVNGCRIRGHAELVTDPDDPVDYWAGNYSSVNVGSYGIVDLKGGYLEVTDCRLDSALARGLYLSFFESDRDTRYLLAGNSIGKNPIDPVEQATAIGLWIGQSGPGAYPPGAAIRTPAGTLDILDNEIRIQRFYYGNNEFDIANGIHVELNYDLNPFLQTSILGNSIDIAIREVSPLSPIRDGISYYGFGSPGEVVHSSAVIRGNSILSSETPALDGVSLGSTFGGLGATGVVLDDNDYSGLTVVRYPVILASLATGNTVNEPTLSCADICGDRSLNTITAADGLCS